MKFQYFGFFILDDCLSPVREKILTMGHSLSFPSDWSLRSNFFAVWNYIANGNYKLLVIKFSLDRSDENNFFEVFWISTFPRIAYHYPCNLLTMTEKPRITKFKNPKKFSLQEFISRNKWVSHNNEI